MIMAPQPNDRDFLSLLQAQAKKQSQLEKNRFFPQQLDFLTSFVGQYSWQVIAVLSGITALVITFLL